MPQDVPEGRWQDVAVGVGFACAVRMDGQLACWGENPEGDLEPPPGRFTDVAAGWYSACAVAEDGEMWCWGQAARLPENHPDLDRIAKVWRPE